MKDNGKTQKHTEKAFFGNQVGRLISDGVVYNGQFAQDRKNGEGVEEWPDGTKYIGNFYNDLKNGKGLMIWPDGDQ
jgi:hypothetical protein